MRWSRAWRRARGASVALLACAGALLAAPAGAPAVTTCVLGNGVLEVQMPSSGDSASLSVLDGGEIVVDNDTPIACSGGTPSVSNTDVISVFNAVNTGNNAVYIGAPSRFAPGASAIGEGGGYPEIEISVNLNDQPGSELFVGDRTLGVPIRFGASGINTNAVADEVQPDADIFPAGVPDLFGVGDGVVATTISAAGGAGTGAPLSDPITMYGGEQGDVLIGGAGPDDLYGHDGGDALSGNGGDDFIDSGGGTHADTIDGGQGTDTAVYDALTGIRVDLAISGPQDTVGAGSDSLAGIENVSGTEFNDVLRGDGGPNRLDGYLGDDVLDGRGGADALGGGPGSDSLFVRDGGPDAGDCGTGADTVTADSVGVDALTACESVLFPLAPPPPSTPPDTIKGKGPQRKLQGHKAKFSFSSDDPAASFECKLDEKTFKPCSSPAKAKKLKPGRHTFKVRAGAGGLVDATPATWRFKVMRKR